MIKLVAFILLVGLIGTCSAHSAGLAARVDEPKSKFLVPRYNITGPGPNDYECISARSSDYYGIGVRLGLYFSWWTAWAASAGMPDEISTALDQNTVFLFANLVALVRCTITLVLTQLDGLVLMHLGMGTIIGVMSSWGYRTCKYQSEGVTAMRNFGGVGTHFRLLCNLGVCIYGVWYWNIGIMPGYRDMLLDTGKCSTVYTFMFGKVHAAGPIRIFYLVMSILWAIHFGIAIVVAPWVSWVRIREIARSPGSIGNELPSELQLATGFNYKQLRYLFQSLRVWSAFWLGWSMVTVEMTLQYNHVKNVLGPGGRIYFPSQLIPMILGGFTFVRLIWKKIAQSRRRNPIDSSIKESSSPAAPQRVSTSKSLMKLMSPPSPVVKKEETEHFKDKDIDSRMVTAGPGWRMLVSYLPWLSLLPRFRQASTTNQTATVTEYKPPDNLESHDYWDQDTPTPSPDPRTDARFVDKILHPRKVLPQFQRSRNQYNIDRFENTIS